MGLKFFNGTMSVQSWQNGSAVCTSDFIRKRMRTYDAEFLYEDAPFRRVMRLWCRAGGNPNHCITDNFHNLPVTFFTKHTTFSMISYFLFLFWFFLFHFFLLSFFRLFIFLLFIFRCWILFFWRIPLLRSTSIPSFTSRRTILFLR